MKRSLLFLVILLALALSVGAFVYAEDRAVSASKSTVKLPTVFADGMVFQRGEPINVFGTCDTSGAEIKVTLGEAEACATVVGTSWSVTLPAMEAARGLTLTVEQQNVLRPAPIVIENVDVGEVIVVSGQSNAVYELYKMEDYEEYLANADNFDNLRVFTTTKAPTPTEEILTYGDGKWFDVTRSFLENHTVDYYISSVGYVAATRLAAEFGSDVTVAVMNLCVSGSSIEPWIGYDHLSRADRNTYNSYKTFYQENGRWPTSSDECSAYGANLHPSKNIPGLLNACYIAPYTGFVAGSAVWYQGESNIGSSNYTSSFNLIKSSYRETFANDTLPFYVVQIQPYVGDAERLFSFRAAQYDFTKNDENVYLIASFREGGVYTTSDYLRNQPSNGVSTFVHNSRKSPIGIKLAEEMLLTRFGSERLTAPKLVSWSVSGKYVTLTFDSDIYLYYGENAMGFQISSNGSSFVNATATVSGNVITLYSARVSSPTHIRYGYGEMTAEHKTGELVECTSSNQNTAAKTVTLTQDGAEYVFTVDGDTALRTMLPGNVTNETGIALPVFKIKVK